ncbi:MAG: cob(I)yrinic acid a,c-diamide adenosyltransferase [Bacteroidota bacterium]
MKIYTRTGDSGQTSLLGGTRVAKHSLRTEAYGTVDELNAWLGVLHDQPVNESRRSFFQQVQSLLFSLGSALAADPNKNPKLPPGPGDEDILALENSMDEMETDLAPLRNFILPGGHQSVSFCHVARTVCRRAERCMTALAEHEHIDADALIYLNRMSDWLFMLGRRMAHELGAEETKWTPRG